MQGRGGLGFGWGGVGGRRGGMARAAMDETFGSELVERCSQWMDTLACHLATPPLECPPSRGRAVGELEGRAGSEEAATASASSGFRSASSSGHEEPREAELL
jgi:hypothetical protein